MRVVVLRGGVLGSVSLPGEGGHSCVLATAGGQHLQAEAASACSSTPPHIPCCPTTTTLCARHLPRVLPP